jgi:hypothetical protein
MRERGQELGHEMREKGQEWGQELREKGQGMFRRIKEFIGKGPRGYSRSDERIKEDVCERLAHGYLDASEIDVSVTAGEVTLEGLVRSRDDRRLAEDIIEGVFGVKDVDNKLKVKKETSTSVSTAAGAGSSTNGGAGGSDINVQGQRPGSTPAHKRS